MRSIFLPALLFAFSTVKAQLKADFNMDKTGGCSPFSVSFTNTTTGASANATYEWNFGNGNTSVLKNAAAVYQDEKTYIVTLTAKDGAQSSAQSKTITVYKKPSVAFTFSPNTGCIPLSINFTSSAQPGDGTLSTYHWDFGDGSTQQSSSPGISHTYNFPLTASVSLTAVNSHGCSNTLTKDNIIKINPALQADFNADKTTLCDLPGTVNFSNSSSGAGTLTYEWDFGDGSTSKDKNPSHSYSKKGTYTVKLTVKSSEGCTDIEEKREYINAGNFNSDIQVPSLICEAANASFTSTASPSPNQTRWFVDGIEAYYWYNSLQYTFMTPGSHKVELINTFNGCEQKVTKQVQVKPVPKLNGFIANIKDLCGGPAKVEFKDTTAGAVSWQWNFNYYAGNSAVHATTKEASYTYPADNWYYTFLTVKNADGCSSSIMQRVDIARPQVGIFLDDGSRSEACGQLTVKMIARSTENIASYSWKFGDGSTSTEASPTHTFTKPGSYPVSLTYKTVNGCAGTVNYPGNIQVWEKPKADFSVQAEVCGNTPVLFTNKTTGYVTNYVWDFGDNGYSSDPNPRYQYQAEGSYTVRLIANNWICNDTIIKTTVIKVSPPFAKIERAANTCDGTRGLVTFTDGSRQIKSWHWDFGDGTTTSYTTAQPNIMHTYAKTGSYKAVLTVTNGACTVKDSTIVYILLKQKPVFSLGKPETCVDQPMTYQVTGLEANPHPISIYNNDYEFSKWEYKDGTQVSASYYYSNNWNINTSGNVTFYQVKDDQVRAIIQSPGFYCQDTTNYVSLKINGVTPQFDVVTDNVCFKLPVVLKENSTPSSGNTIATWEWNFGDGTNKTYTQGGTVNHIYKEPGSYYVSLKVTDEKGCSSNTPYYNGFVRVAGPKASFYVPGGNTVQLNTNVFFYNTTNTAYSYNVSYKWDFGNGVTSTDYSPSYTYTESGRYDVVLIAENKETGCSDTTRQTITVKIFNTAFTFTTAFIGNYGTCPPVRANFTNVSTNYTKLVWDFGDGFTLEDQPYPSHVYERAGKYAVTLTVHGYNGLVGVYEDTVIVQGPTATIAASDLDGCIGTEVKLNALEHTDTDAYVWDFGDGYVANVADSFATHTYVTPGIYTPSLILKDDKGCSSLISLQDKVTIFPDPAIIISPSSPVVCKGVGVELKASGAETYEWSPEAGLSNVNGLSTIATPAETTTYSIKARDLNGCTGATTTTVTVPKPFTTSISPDASICKGNSVMLAAGGADSYQWINTTTGLSGIQMANPVASPLNTTQYTVVGYDQYKCYTDTAQVNVIVRPSPTVNAGDDKEVIYGSPTTLNIITSNDVVRWNWTPSEFLSCTNCPSPITKPYKSMEYAVEVFNEYNCSAKDSVLVKGGCADKNIFIPTAFTPNVDGLNDRFIILGNGVSIIRSLRIFNRWGEIVFEKKNFYPNDNNSAWNGKYKGIEAPAGAYVYFAEMECNAGETLTRKGTVTLIR